MATRLSSWNTVQPASVEHRRGTRRRVELVRATVRAHGEAPTPATLGDVSTFGCRLVADTDFTPDERVWVRLDGAMAIAATVVWTREGSVGCRFDSPIAKPLMRTLLREGL